MAQRFVEKYGKWAVVTGSTDGIGKEYACELARNGMNIVLVSRTMEKLEKVALEIREEFGVETKIVQADFSSGRQVYEKISRDLYQKDIGILVNNVGMMTPHPMLFEDLSEDDIWGLINVNVASVPAMTKLVLPGMLERKRGAIINVSSMAAFVPFPFLQMYTGSKAFGNFFSQAVECEYRSSGIIIQTVLPGRVATKMLKFDAKNPPKPSILSPTASTYVYHALSTLAYSRHTTGYWAHGIQLWFLKRIPNWLAMWSYGQANMHYAYQKKTT